MNIDPDAALAYLNFVEQRHLAWRGKMRQAPQPWCSDPIVQQHKFTNVFRVLDFGSQFVLTDLDDPKLSDRDQLARLFLYRHTGRVETWQYLDLVLGGYPTVASLSDALEAWKVYRGEGKRKLHPPRRPGQKGPGNGPSSMEYKRSVFTGAYQVCPQSQERGTYKLESIVNLTRRLFEPDSPDYIMPDWMWADTQAERFEVLRRNQGVAEFMSMQILTDWGYLQRVEEDRENDFVVAGPGCVKGAKLLDPRAKPLDVILWAQDQIHRMFPSVSLELPSGGFRAPTLMDVQNTLCEFSKYARYESQSAPGRPYTPAHPGPQPQPVLPGSW